MEMFNLHAEQTLIGASILDNTILDSAGITEEDFFFPANRKAWLVFQDLRSQSKPVDLITISEAWKDVDIGWLAELVRNSLTYTVPAHVEILKKKTVERKLFSTLKSLMASVADDIPLEEKLEMAESAILAVRPESKAGVVIAKDAMRPLLAELEYLHDNKGKIHGLETGFVDLDKRFNGIRDGDLVVIAARPSMGKTTFAMNIVEHQVLNQDKAALFFSLEMTKEDLLQKILASNGGLDYNQIRTAEILDTNPDRFMSTASKMVKARLYIDDNTNITLQEMKAKARKVKQLNPDLSCIVVDYLQLMAGDGENREREVANISRGLKQLARELLVPVFALSQLNRGLEARADKRPVMSDLRESGAIEQDADIIMFLYRDEVYNDATTEKGVAHIITRKYRKGEIGTDYLSADLAKSRFVNSTYQPIANTQYGKTKRGTFNYE